MIRRLVILLLALGAGSASAADQPPEKTDPRMPRAREYSYVYDVLNNSVFRPTTRVLDPALLARRVSGNHREAENVDAADAVRLPSTWWQPRLGYCEVSVEQMLAGPGPRRGPAQGRWTITKAKTQGVTPGFQIKDANGDKFLIKFDPKAYPELSTSADVVGSLLFWAAGYNTPENTIAWFRPQDLDIADDATYTTATGAKKKFTPEYLNALLASVYRQKDGRFRCSASRFIKGKPLGPFKYNGRRRDDPEDLIPHEHRRELRGLWSIAAWANHADIRGPNSFDAWVTDHDRSFVRHYLIDFSAILGAGPNGPRSRVTGTEYYVDANVAMKQFATAGLRKFDWEGTVDPGIPSVGMVESVKFDPVRWRPDYPNPAFDERTERDVRWGARIVAAFSNEHIEAAVKAAQYSDPRAAQYVTRVLQERRDKIVRSWIGTGSGGSIALP